MSIVRFLGLALFIVGVVLIAFGVHSMQTPGENVVANVTGHYSNTTMWYIIGGILLVIVGGWLGFMKRRL